MDFLRIGKLIGTFVAAGVILSAAPLWVSAAYRETLIHHPVLDSLVDLFQLMFCPVVLLPWGDILDLDGNRMFLGSTGPILMNVCIYLVIGIIFALGLYWKRIILYLELVAVALYWSVCIFFSLKSFLRF